MGTTTAVTNAFTGHSGGIMEQHAGPQRAKTRVRGNGQRALNTAQLTTQQRQHAHIDELCHRMTVAESRAVRMQLCVELKRAIAEYLESAGGSR